MASHYTLTLSCPDKIGIVAKVSQFIAEHKGSIVEASQHGDPISRWFFMRVVIDTKNLLTDLAGLQKAFSELANEFNMKWSIKDNGIKKRVAILTSKHDHCIADLLYRWRSKEFDFDISCVISNHNDLKAYTEWHGLPYFHVPITKDNKQHAFAEIEKLYEEHNSNVMVLARFMQILPPQLCEKYFGQVINIHHSFLPSFSGANPYLQAYKQGVKLIGATCHYVTTTLDAGPIIDQDVVRVHHGYSVDDLKRMGKDVEKNVLARGLRYHLQNRVLIHDNKTVVFD